MAAWSSRKTQRVSRRHRRLPPLLLPSVPQLLHHTAVIASGAGGLAWGSYLDSRHSPSNFGQLRVTTSGQHPDERQLQAAGFLEGYLTAQRIWDSFLNMRDYFKAGMGAEIEKPMRW